MPHRVNRMEFLQVLNRVQPGLSAKAYIEQSSCFVFTDGWLCSFNGEICCRTKSGLPDDFSGAVQAAPLMSLLETMSDDEVELQPTAKELSVRGHRKRAGVRMESEVVLPIDSIEQPPNWTLLPEDFNAAIKQAVEGAGTNEEEFLTTCVHIHPDWVESCDRIRVVRYDLPTGVTKPVLVRAKSIKHMTALGLTKMGETEQWMHFRNKTLIFSCRRHLETFFNTTPLLEVNGEKATLPRGAKEAAKLTGIFSGEDKANDSVLVTLSDGKMQVRGEGTFGWADTSLEMAYHGPNVSFRISPKMLEQLVASYTECTIGTGKLWVVGEKWRFATVLATVGTSSASRVPVAVGAESDDQSETETELEDGDE